MDETHADVEIERAALRYELARTRRELAEAQATIRLLTGDLDAARARIAELEEFWNWRASRDHR